MNNTDSRARISENLLPLWCLRIFVVFLICGILPLRLSVAASDPNQGSGGPILVLSSSISGFGKYYAEILRTEGLNAFAVADIATMTPASLAGYTTVVLSKMPLTSNQVSTITNWVTSGGNLIAMDPDPQLAGLLGITSGTGTITNGYLLVNGATRLGNGIVNQTIQFHGSARLNTLNGATSIGTLFFDAANPTSSPAVTVRSVGSNGGKAASFAFDLATSIVYTRQGNPIWATQERDGFAPIRPDDMFYGNAAGDAQPDWVDRRNIAIPQADELQRLLANMIISMSLQEGPIPRFWYFPSGKKAVVVMTGDDHGMGGTSGRFNQFIASSPAGCSVADWGCIRGTSYIYPNTPVSDAQAASFNAAGFEVGLHVNTGCADYTPVSLEGFYTQQIADWKSAFPSLPAPITQRHHCIVWSDWVTGAKIQLDHGMRLDTSYYYWPPAWANDTPGHFTGSAMPMRFADTDGSLVDVYQAVTQMTDESGQSYPFTIDTLLDRALGAEENYGAYTVNAHTDLASSSVSDAVVASALARGVPIVSSKQMLTWLDGRNSSSFGGINWSGNVLSFSVVPAIGANGLQVMLPWQSAGGVLGSISMNGSPLPFSKRVVKGFEYAVFQAAAGSYSATYAVDTAAPTVLSTVPAVSATGVPTALNLSVAFNEAIDPSTIISSTIVLRDASNVPVPSAISYSAATSSATLTPSSALALNTTYTATVKGGASGVKDLAGNALATDLVWTFTTVTGGGGQGGVSIWSASAAPVNPAANDTAALELGVKFRSDAAGYITGIRFFKGTGNTGTHIGNLWSSAGQNLGTATFANETASGWQQVDFTAPVAIAANTTYIASYHAPNGRYPFDAGYFASAGVDNAPLHALSNAAAGGNGVYAYSGSSTFPSSSYQSSNYWVDVVFSSSASDTTAPTVVSNTPANNATGVSTATTVTATFSENTTNVSGTTFLLTGPGSTAVAATVTYDAATFKATLTPSSALALNTTYTATVKGGASGVKDLAGNALAGDVIWTFTTATTDICAAGNAIVVENCKTGNPSSEWDVSGAGDSSIQGFATDISVNRGQVIGFKVKTTASNYRLDIYRMGYYAGLGARKVATVQPSATLPQSQPACVTDPTSKLADCGNWAVSASWSVPANAASGIYFAKLVRADTGGASHVVFIVRDDAGGSDLLFQTSDLTWQAYNNYTDSLYGTATNEFDSANRAYKVSYNRPFRTRAMEAGVSWVFNAEYPMVRWLEANGYNVSYFTGVDSARFGNLIPSHKAFLSVGHDEYWSSQQRTNVEAARDTGVNLAFFSGNTAFWKTRWENSIDGSGTPYRTLVCYKETHANAKIDPSPEWTGTWRDPRFSPPSDGGRPENALKGTAFMVNGPRVPAESIQVLAEDGKMRFWRNTSLPGMASGQTATLPAGSLGYEWDVDLDNGFRPAGIVRMSNTLISMSSDYLQDYGSTYGPGVATHTLTLYRQPVSKALVFDAGSVQWSWGLDSNHDMGVYGTSPLPPDPRMQQATVNLFADMGVQPSTIQSGLTVATKSTDILAPTSAITSPATGANLPLGSAVTISGTAVDGGGGVIGGVEVSVDGGATWHLAVGRTSWSYTWNPMGSGAVTIKSRAVDDTGNLETPAAGNTVTIGTPDTTPPAASISAPASGASVSGTTVTISANASDNVGVASVQFLLDGAPLGGPDTSQPYSISWNTTTATNGSHTLSARAVDAAGNTTVSAGVVVTVSNVAASVPAAVDDRFLFQANVARTINNAGSLGLGVLANDTDTANLPLTAVAVGTLPAGVTLASNGTVTINRGSATSFRYRANDGAQLSQPTTGALATLALNSAPTAVAENCIYNRSGSGSVTGSACVMTGTRTFMMNLKANDTDPNTATNIPTDGIGKTVARGIVTATGTGVTVSANSACGQAAIVKTASRATIVNNCDGTLAITVSPGASALPISLTYGAVDDLGAASASLSRATDTITVQ